MKSIVLILLLMAATTVCAQMPRTPAPQGASVYIISPAHGEVVSGPITVRFGLKGMGVAPAGVEKEGTGHHHLLIDLAKMPDMTAPLPMNDNLIHFGGGQTQTVIDLPPGEHTLQLLLADWAHIPFDPPLMSERITITVQ